MKPERRLSADDVITAVCGVAGIEPGALRERSVTGATVRRDRTVNAARSAAAVVMRDRLGMSYPAITEALGWASHNSAVMACRGRSDLAAYYIASATAALKREEAA